MRFCLPEVKKSWVLSKSKLCCLGINNLVWLRSALLNLGSLTVTKENVSHNLSPKTQPPPYHTPAFTMTRFEVRYA